MSPFVALAGLVKKTTCFSTGVRGTSGFREWLPGVLPKQTDFAWDEIRSRSSRSSMRL